MFISFRTARATLGPPAGLSVAVRARLDGRSLDRAVAVVLLTTLVDRRASVVLHIVHAAPGARDHVLRARAQLLHLVADDATSVPTMRRREQKGDAGAEHRADHERANLGRALVGVVEVRIFLHDQVLLARPGGGIPGKQWVS